MFFDIYQKNMYNNLVKRPIFGDIYKNYVDFGEMKDWHEGVFVFIRQEIYQVKDRLYKYMYHFLVFVWNDEKKYYDEPFRISRLDTVCNRLMISYDQSYFQKMYNFYDIQTKDNKFTRAVFTWIKSEQCKKHILQKTHDICTNPIILM